MAGQGSWQRDFMANRDRATCETARPVRGAKAMRFPSGNPEQKTLGNITKKGEAEHSGCWQREILKWSRLGSTQNKEEKNKAQRK